MEQLPAMMRSMHNDIWVPPFGDAGADITAEAASRQTLLSYELSSSCAKLELLPGTAFIPGSGGGWTVPLLVVVDRR